jgi:hypothetical protein
VEKLDILTILAPGESVRPEALAALAAPEGIEIRHYFAEGRRFPGEMRIDAIVRARNAVKQMGEAELAMFLDRDVALPAGAVLRLARMLHEDPSYGALGVDYQSGAGHAGHVAMGALMFRRAVLDQIRIRAEPGRCECACCCADLRAMGYRVEYAAGLRARHIRARLSF